MAAATSRSTVAETLKYVRVDGIPGSLAVYFSPPPQDGRAYLPIKIKDQRGWVERVQFSSYVGGVPEEVCSAYARNRCLIELCEVPIYRELLRKAGKVERCASEILGTKSCVHLSKQLYGLPRSLDIFRTHDDKVVISEHIPRSSLLAKISNASIKRAVIQEEDCVRRVWEEPGQDELDALRQLQGKVGIVKMYASGVYRTKKGKIKGIEILKRYKSDFFAFLSDDEKYKEIRPYVTDLAHQFLLGARAIYDLGIHQDLRDKNVLFDWVEGKPVLAITDFGLFISLNSLNESEVDIWGYTPPEYLFFEPQGDLRNYDSWDAGIFLAQLFCPTLKGREALFPFLRLGIEDRAGRASFAEIPERVSRYITDLPHPALLPLLLGLLERDARRRWTIPQALAYFEEHILAKS